MERQIPAVQTGAGGAVALALGFTREEIDVIRNTVAKGATDMQLALFLQVCKARALNPFTRQVHWSPVGVITGIDGLRAIAARTQRYMPGPTRYTETNGALVAAHVTVKILGPDKAWHDLEETAYLQEYKGTTPIWAKMPHVMLAKVAESRALRRAFPEDLSGLYEVAEMEGAATVEAKGEPATTDALEALTLKLGGQADPDQVQNQEQPGIVAAGGEGSGKPQGPVAEGALSSAPSPVAQQAGELSPSPTPSILETAKTIFGEDVTVIHAPETKEKTEKTPRMSVQGRLETICRRAGIGFREWAPYLLMMSASFRAKENNAFVPGIRTLRSVSERNYGPICGRLDDIIQDQNAGEDPIALAEAIALEAGAPLDEVRKERDRVVAAEAEAAKAPF